ncbi:DASH family cryptochrome [Pseudoalteromonas sp. J010]|uniref:DASH family cryptochrome n=1 Tax=Pseudoalteromonas sp. J010 TaxID=998465 RepID=UPI000F64F138|nr:DASH family cryptochrome [Pseudoalteromonas sp. J010]RRS08812.1 DASH family cryptochrome [Pseudoalteromonas sp. J010]
MKIGLYVFDNDCRLKDNPSLVTLASQVERLICVYLPNNNIWSSSKAQCSKSVPASAYEEATVAALQQELDARHQALYIVPEANKLQGLVAIIRNCAVTHIGRSVHSGADEHKYWLRLQTHCPEVKFISEYAHTLFTPDMLPFSLNELPPSFTPFRKRVEALVPNEPLPAPQLPPKPPNTSTLVKFTATGDYSGDFYAGEKQAQDKLKQYFQTDAAKQYKETRNALCGDGFSTQFSPILATGAVSPRQVKHALNQFEHQYGANESTYWIWFELLWREYFQWYALKHQHRLFAFTGVKNKKPTTSFYPERFQKWCQSKTPSAFINAIMTELRETGWISNRARQITASYFVNELQLDWRYGAAFFEQNLIDYDVAANWGNWQYIAGVGADPRGGRHFNLAKQQSMFDPNGEYIMRWRGTSHKLLDTRDYVDWPLEE